MGKLSHSVRADILIKEGQASIVDNKSKRRDYSKRI